jgi:hypothetical protein
MTIMSEAAEEGVKPAVGERRRHTGDNDRWSSVRPPPPW